MLTTEDQARAAEIARVFGNKTVLFASMKASTAASKLVAFHTKGMPNDKRVELAGVCADAVLLLLEVVALQGAGEEFLRILRATMDWQEEQAVKELEARN